MDTDFMVLLISLGWWLSMKKEDSFLKKMQPLEKLPEIMDRKSRFARNEETADKTLGFVLVRKMKSCS
jgi:hypothetical protein